MTRLFVVDEMVMLIDFSQSLGVRPMICFETVKRLLVSQSGWTYNEDDVENAEVMRFLDTGSGDLSCPLRTVLFLVKVL